MLALIMINNWVEKTIIGLDLCPFTLTPYQQGKVLIESLSATDSISAQDQFLTALSSFQAQKDFVTALFGFPDWKLPFREFYEFSEDCENHLLTLGLEDEFQLVAFHPQFCFEGLDYSERANLVNSSPYPILHLLRIHDLELLSLSPKEAEAISFGNGDKLAHLSELEIQKHFPWR